MRVPCILYVVFVSTNNAQYIYIYIYIYFLTNCIYIIGKAVPLQAWSGPEDSRK